MPMQPMQNKVALITGGSTGIGRAIAEAFAEAGASVVLAARNAEKLAAAAAAIGARGGKVLAVPTDITDEAAVARLFAQLREAHGRIDVLVNNAGGTTRTPTADLTPTDFRRVMETNVTGAFLCAREAFAMMKAQGGGRIINIGSVSAKVPRADSVPYTTSKFALEGLTRAFALDGRAHGIAVSVLQPGNTESEIWAGREAHAAREGVMAAADVARVALLMATLPASVNLLESVILPVSMPFLGRG
jgi:NAD(P)-dependent dehydrogenase (short-subunit alcohol dehydrogenase family)